MQFCLQQMHIACHTSIVQTILMNTVCALMTHSSMYMVVFVLRTQSIRTCQAQHTDTRPHNLGVVTPGLVEALYHSTCVVLAAGRIQINHSSLLPASLSLRRALPSRESARSTKNVDLPKHP